MKSAMLAWVVLALGALVPPAGGQAQEPQQASLEAGRVVIASIKGDVVIRALGGATVPSVRGQALGPGTVVETGKGSIVLDLPDGSQAQVKSNTRLELKDPAKDRGFSLELFLGRVLTKIKKKLGSEPSFSLGTPSAVITVRGTEFLTEVDKKGKTAVYVYEGIVEVQGLVPGSKPVFVRPGFWTEVPPHRPAREPGPIDLNQRMMGSPSDQDGWGSAPSNRTGGMSGQRGSDSSQRQQQPSQQTSGEQEKPD